MKVGVDSHEQITDLKVEKIGKGNVATAFLNQRTSVISKNTDKSMLPLLHITKRERYLIDTKQDFLLTKQITFEAGHVGGTPNSLKDFFGVNLTECNAKKGNTSYENWASAINIYANIGEKND